MIDNTTSSFHGAANTAPRKKSQARTEPLGEKLPYPGGFPVYLSRYVLFGGAKPRAAMRFFNASDILVTGIRFRLSEMDADGRVIAEYSIERDKLFVESGSEFSVADTPVNKACASIAARLESVVSAPYEYIVSGDGVKVVYGTEEREPERYFKEKAVYSAKRYRKKYTLITVVSLLAVFLAAGFVVWKTGLFEKLSDTGKRGVETATTYICRDSQNVETQRHN